MSKTRYNNPSFLCIGYKKTGTTWLYEALSQFPAVELPRSKESRFYWGAGDPQKLYNDVKRGPIRSRIGEMSIGWRSEYLARSFRAFRNKPSAISISALWWDMKYCFLPQSPRWYKSLFPKYKYSGDIDPHYVYFSDEIISKIKARHPEIKIILILRHPIDMYWSHFRMWAYKIRRIDPETMSLDHIIRRLRHTVNSSPRFCETIDRWSRHFDSDHFHVSFYDDLVKDPYQYLKGIAEFLGLDIDTVASDDIGRFVHKGVPLDLPGEVELSVYEMLIPDLVNLCNKVDSDYPEQWLEQMQTRKELLHKEVIK